jgi:hypothetical protein
MDYLHIWLLPLGNLFCFIAAAAATATTTTGMTSIAVFTVL